LSGRSVFPHAFKVSRHEEFIRESAAAARIMQDEDSSRQAMERAVAVATRDPARLRRCRRLFSNDHDLGALNLYGKSTSAFSADDVYDGTALAAHVAVALAAAQEVESLEQALVGRTVISQATGILMERFDMTPDRAFAVLSRLSQDKNSKLRQLAEQIVPTRTVPAVALRRAGSGRSSPEAARVR